MGKCPFWSNGKNKVSCNSECPMNAFSPSGDKCVFKEHITESKIDFKDIVDCDFEFANDKQYESLGLDFFEEEEKV